MAPNKSMGVRDPQSLIMGKGVNLSDKFQCRVCGLVKKNVSFSKKELNSFVYAKEKGQNVTGFSAKLRCRVCSGEDCQEITCDGPCGLTKPKDEFSKNARTKGEFVCCILCTEWREGQEPGLVATAALTHSVDSKENAYSDWNDVDICTNYDTANHHKEDEEDADPDLDGFPSLTFHNNTISNAGQSARSASGINGRHRGMMSSASVSTSANYSAVPTHLRARGHESRSDTSSVSNPYEDCTDLDTSTSEGWSTVGKGSARKTSATTDTMSAIREEWSQPWSAVPKGGSAGRGLKAQGGNIGFAKAPGRKVPLKPIQAIDRAMTASFAVSLDELNHDNMTL